jgi:hypothetical protein
LLILYKANIKYIMSQETIKSIRAAVDQAQNQLAHDIVAGFPKETELDSAYPTLEECKILVGSVLQPILGIIPTSEEETTAE